MKMYFFFLLFIFNIAYSFGQEFYEVTNTPKVTEGVKTNEILTVEGVEFDIYETTSTKSKYVKGISVKGNPYNIWIGEKTDYLYEGYPVRKFKSGTYAIFKLSKTEYPVARYLKKE